jgi:hypothetical protein
MVASASFRPLVAVLQGLRSHDERLVEQLASRVLISGKDKIHVKHGEDGRIVGAARHGRGRGDEGASAWAVGAPPAQDAAGRAGDRDGVGAR